MDTGPGALGGQGGAVLCGPSSCPCARHAGVLCTRLLPGGFVVPAHSTLPLPLRARRLSFWVVVIHVGVSSSDVIFLRSESPLSFGSQPLSAVPVALDTDCHCPWFLKCRSGPGADGGPGASGCYRRPAHWKVHCRLGSTGSSGCGDSYRKLELRGRPDVCEMKERPGVGKAGLP